MRRPLVDPPVESEARSRTSPGGRPFWWTRWDWFDAAILVSLAVCLAFANQTWETTKSDCNWFSCAEGPNALHDSKGPTVVVFALMLLLGAPWAIARRAVLTGVFLLSMGTAPLDDLHLFSTVVATYPAQHRFYVASQWTLLVCGVATAVAVAQALRRRRERNAAPPSPPPING